MTLESTIGADEFMLDLDIMNAFINEEVMPQEEEDFWEEPYQVLPDPPNMDNVADQENAENAVDNYEVYIH